MSFTRFTKDPGVISALSNKPNTSDGLTPAALKAKFDEFGTAFQTYVNETLLPEIEEAGAEAMGIEEIQGLVATTVQEALQELKEAIDQATTGTLPNGSVTTDKLAALAVTSAKLGELAVITAKIADGAVTAAKLAANAVETGKLADGAVTAAKLAAASATHEKLGVNAVERDNIKDGEVVAGKLGAGAVTSDKLAADAVRLRFSDVSATFAAEQQPTYTDFPYVANIVLTGVTGAMTPEVVFGADDALSGDYAPVASCYGDANGGGVYLYAAKAGTVTVPTILCWR